MLTWGDVRRWDPAAIGAVADALNDGCVRITAAGEDVESMVRFPGWSGEAALAASTRGESLTSTLEQLVAEASAVRRGAHEVQLALDRIVAFVRETDELAARNGVTIGHGGELSSPGGPSEPRVMAELADRVEQILRRATDVDADFAAIMRRALRGEITEQDSGTLAQAAVIGAAQSGLSIIGPPEHGSPGDNKAWWDSLSDTAKVALLQRNPGLVGNLDGIPATDRDAANRAVLAREIERLQGDPRVKGLEAIARRLDQPEPRAFLLGLDTSGDGKAIVSAGNPDTAANVATYVPGTGAELAKIGGDLDRSDKMWAVATTAGSPSTAVITWLGYDAPDEITDAASGKYADGGKAALAQFQDGLRETHQGTPSHNTVLGHSYGTTVAGHAARDGGLAADELVFVASPGVGAHEVSQLHLDGVDPGEIGGHVHATVAEHDMINLANLEIAGYDLVLGQDPTDAEFGGRVFTSAPGTDGFGGYSRHAHSEYWEDNNPSLRNIGLIIAGKPAS
ncbi:alpha/beta hydrolase [Amycolatopsis regifaucium]|uniref:Alpha/beta hydrolase n=1 Tax=Amycolatopsis regifaucium TaxID=546365 RepID=A0A154MK24_9PSEU|nr:alpha/beta hydrolase [Amycolatopsis regifaucium]KZB84656.1 alpha/beta hydrolase [Amycolatopsis regifaucium]OKA11120.1 alpha/beta hydrolase [Amycolatopsis regifaucium]SFI29187.1 Alpha/beta hydrolase [Amycolatopsis regifaucium]